MVASGDGLWPSFSARSVTLSACSEPGVQAGQETADMRKMFAAAVSGDLFRLLTETISGNELEKLPKDAIVTIYPVCCTRVKDAGPL